MTRMIQCLLLLSALAITFASCRSPEPPPASGSTPTAAESAPAPAEEVRYEPAYPSDVSSESLSEEDVAQQETDPSDEGGDHPHGDGDHTHDEEDEDGGHQH